MPKSIRAVWGPWPSCPDEDPTGAAVGISGVTKIERREENLGTYGIVWFDVYVGNEVLRSLNALHIEQIEYDRSSE